MELNIMILRRSLSPRSLRVSIIACFADISACYYYPCFGVAVATRAKKMTTLSFNKAYMPCSGGGAPMTSSSCSCWILSRFTFGHESAMLLSSHLGTVSCSDVTLSPCIDRSNYESVDLYICQSADPERSRFLEILRVCALGSSWVRPFSLARVGLAKIDSSQLGSSTTSTCSGTLVHACVAVTAHTHHAYAPTTAVIPWSHK